MFSRLGEAVRVRRGWYGWWGVHAAGLKELWAWFDYV